MRLGEGLRGVCGVLGYLGDPGNLGDRGIWGCGLKKYALICLLFL